MSSMQLSAEGLSGPLAPHSTASQSCGPDAPGCAYAQGYMPLFPQRGPSQPGGPPPGAHGPLPHGLPEDHGALSVITHTTTASASPGPGHVASTYHHLLEYSSAPAQEAPSPQLPPGAPCLAPCPAAQPQTFALPRAVHGPGGGKAKGRPMQRIVPATSLPSSHLLLTGQEEEGSHAFTHICICFT